MSTMKDKPAGSASDSKIILLANPTTGAMEQITLLQLKTYISASQLATPTGFTVTSASSTSLTSSWSAVTNATSYTLDRSPDGSTSWTNVYTGSGLTYTNTGLTAGTTYYYRVKATASGYTDSAYANANAAPSTYDSAASAFFTAAGITDTTQKSAVNQLILDLKAASIWTKMQAIYPFVGGTATTHKWNLVNPADTDAAFRIAFSGTITHNANGITGDGSTGWGNTFLSASNTTATSIHLAIYSKTSTVSNGYAMGSGGISGGTPTVVIEPRYTSDVIYACTNNYFSDANDYSYANTNGTGFYITSRTASNAWFIQKGATESSVFTNATVSPYFPDTINLLRMGGAASNYSNRNLAFASVGTGLTTAEADLLNTAVTAFQTTLSRA